MKRLAFLACVYVSQLGCLAVDTPRTADGGGGPDQKCPPLPDLAAPMAKCVAAKGLAGDTLLCVDFSSLSPQQLGSPLPSELKDWDFTTNCGGKLWQIAGGKLQIQNFSSFASNCAFLMPVIDLNAPDKQKYKSITLAIVQQVDLDVGTVFPNQFAQLYNGTVNLAFLLSQTSGTQPEQQFTITLDKSKIPAAMNNVVKYLLQVSSSMAQNKQGLQISSIAVMGNTQ